MSIKSVGGQQAILATARVPGSFFRLERSTLRGVNTVFQKSR